MKFREAKLADLETIVALLADDELGQKREAFQLPLPNSYLLAFQKIAEDENQELIVLEGENGQILGTMQLSFLQYLTYQGGVRAQIEAVRIDKTYRGQGLGSIMFKWAIDRAKKKGAHLLQLTTDKLRPEAIHFYENLGFRATHEGMKMHF